MIEKPASEDNRDVTIEKMVLGGYGLGRLPSGKVVLVTGVLPGEKVAIKTVRKKKDYQIAMPAAVTETSAFRVSPPCPYYEICGGCDLQHISYRQQLAEKRSMLIDHFGHSGLGQTVLERVEEVVPSAREFGYRQRIRLHVDSDTRAIGYHRKDSHQVVDIAACLIADPLLNEVLAGLRQNAQFIRLVRQITEISLLKDETAAGVTAVLKWRRKLRPAEKKVLEELVLQISILEAFMVEDSTGHKVIPATKKEQLFLRFTLKLDGPAAHPLRIRVESGGFTQVNTGVNHALIKTVLDWAEKLKSRRVLDLFCGMGNFAIPLSLVADEVYGVDLQRAAIRAAERNAEDNGRENCYFLRGSAQEGAARLLAEGERFDTVVLDPPRQGCSEVIDAVDRLGAVHLIYVSCDPATLARDLGLLLSRHFRIEAIKPFDMFPQTHHLETVVLLTREDAGT
ncbi:MAG: 23S rRNA (uracil(1939)-C(5))-methyltransferase RlmD [Deltaproteobacteria bacterium]